MGRHSTNSEKSTRKKNEKDAENFLNAGKDHPFWYDSRTRAGNSHVDTVVLIAISRD